MTQTRNHKPVRAAGAFTLTEVIVAVGILSIVAVGIATIFAAVGDTVAAGRSVSQRNEVIAQIERVMRQDFEQFSRRGPLIIRHEYAIANESITADTDNDDLPDGLNVPLTAGGVKARPRRVDSIAFFAEGEFTTARPPVHPSMIARSGEALIYYGHGQVRNPELDPDLYTNPDLRDNGVFGRYFQTSPNTDPVDFADATARLGYDPGPGGANPNRYPADPDTFWTLLRRPILLISDSGGSAQSLPVFSNDGFFGDTSVDRDDPDGRIALLDAPFQIALQPAVDTVFSIAQPLDPTITDPALPGFVEAFRTAATFDNPNRVPRITDTGMGGYPDRMGRGGYRRLELARARLGSGLIDIATTSLADVRSLITNAGFNPTDPTDPGAFRPVPDRRMLEIGLRQGRGPTSARQQRQWILTLLPTPPVFDFLTYQAVGYTPGSGSPPTSLSVYGIDVEAGERTTARMRYEPQPPELNLVSTDGTSNTNNRINASYREADQAMLTRSAFLSRCTEFIIEWSFGEILDEQFGFTRADPRYGQLRWYGRDRWALDADGDRIDQNGDNVVDLDDRIAYEFDPTQLVANVSDPVDSRRFEVLSAIVGDIPGGPANSPPPQFPLHSTFGYFDAQDMGDETQYTPWEWPAFIRVTLSYVEAGDPENEQTVQFVFEVPSE